VNKLRDSLKRVTLTHVLLFAVAVFLCLNWLEQRKMNHALKNLVRSVYMVDCDLSDNNCFIPPEYQVPLK
jgi:hypothetical protein